MDVDAGSILKVLVQILATGGGAAAVAYGVFALLGKKWLDAKFAERLEAFRHAQEQELEHYRFQVNSLFNRVSKVHEKEFEVLPEAWKRLQDALGQVAQFTSPVQSYPPLSQMTTEEFDEFLETCRLSKSEVLEIRRLHRTEREAYYRKRIFWHDLNDVKRAVGDFHNYLLYNKIFLSRELFAKFSEIDEKLYAALSSRELGHVSRDPKIRAQSYQLLGGDEITTLGEEIESLIQQRLHYDEAV